MQLEPDWSQLGEDVRVLVVALDPAQRRELQDAVEHCPRNAVKIVNED